MHRFIVAESKRCSVASTKCVVSGLRILAAFFALGAHHLYLTGRCCADGGGLDGHLAARAA